MRVEEVKVPLNKEAKLLGKVELLLVIALNLIEHHVLIEVLDGLNLIFVVLAVGRAKAWRVQGVLSLKGLANRVVALSIVIVRHF